MARSWEYHEFIEALEGGMFYTAAEVYNNGLAHGVHLDIDDWPGDSAALFVKAANDQDLYAPWQVARFGIDAQVYRQIEGFPENPKATDLQELRVKVITLLVDFQCKHLPEPEGSSIMNQTVYAVSDTWRGSTWKAAFAKVFGRDDRLGREVPSHEPTGEFSLGPHSTPAVPSISSDAPDTQADHTGCGPERMNRP